MTSANNTVVAPERQLTIVRTFDAPRALVFKAWTDPAMLLKWMGPREYPGIATEGEVRVGATSRSTLRSLDGTQTISNRNTYREVTPPERLAFTFAWDNEDGTPGRPMECTISFDDVEGQTRMTFHQEVFDDQADRDDHNEGWNSSFDRLDELLASAAA